MGDRDEGQIETTQIKRRGEKIKRRGMEGS